MKITALIVSPDPAPLGRMIDVMALVEFDGPARPIEVCLSVAAPIAIDDRAMLCQSVFGASPVSVAFRVRISGPSALDACELTALVSDGEGPTSESRHSIRLSI